MAKAKIYISFKSGILDPQGKTVENALKSLGYKNVSKVRIGKYIELEITGKPANRKVSKQLKEMCDKLLANPIIEDYRFEIADKL